MATKRALVNYLGQLSEVTSTDTLAPSTLGTNSPGVSNFLRGDGAWIGGVALTNSAAQSFTGTSTFAGALNLSNGQFSLRSSLGLYSSTFTQSDGALPAEWSRGTSFYATNATSITVVSNQAKLNLTSGADALQYLNTGAMSDGTVQADLTRGGGIVARYSTAGTGYLLLLASDGTVYFSRLSAGQADTPMFNTAAGYATSGTFRLVCAGTTVQAYIGATLLSTQTDIIYGNGYAGLYAQPAASNSVDNFSFTPGNPASEYNAVFIEGGALKVRSSAGVVTTYAPARVVTTVSGSSTITASLAEQVLLVSAAGGANAQTLPSAALTQGSITVKKTDSSSNAVTVTATGGQTIDGGATAPLSAQYTSLTLVSDGSNWAVI